MPLEFNDWVILLTLMSIVLLLTTELQNPSHGYSSLIIEKDRLKKVTYVIILIYLPFIIVKIFEIIST